VACIPIFLLLSNVRIATTDQHVYAYGFSRYHAAAVTGIERAELDRAAREIVDYLSSNDRHALLDVRVTVGGQSQPLFNEREVRHMLDVKHLFQFFFNLHQLAFVYLVVYVVAVYLWTRERSLRRLAGQAIIGGVITAAALTIAAAAMLVGFQQIFTAFHLLSFSNDFWQLDPTRDRLVQMFPLGFWFDVSLLVGIATVVQGGLVALAGYAYREWTERTAEQRRRARLRARAEAEGPVLG
jgi:integral membrane protein (TIGR01906 family)